MLMMRVLLDRMIGRKLEAKGGQAFWARFNPFRLIGAKVTSSELLPELSACRRLSTVIANDTLATDRQIAPLLKLPELEFLFMSNALVTDDLVGNLVEAKGLRILAVDGTAITEPSIRLMKRSMPYCKIISTEDERTDCRFPRLPGLPIET